VSILSFLRKYGETEDPLFQDLPIETPPPDQGDLGSEMAAMSVEPSQVDPSLGAE
jgi:hypothetical protein